VLSARFELGKVESKDVWRRAIAQFRRVDRDLARRVATGLFHPHEEDASVVDLLLPRR
jgi:catalase